MREFRTSGSVGAPASNRWGDPTTPILGDHKIPRNYFACQTRRLELLSRFREASEQVFICF